MISRLREIFFGEKIEYFGALPYSEATETRGYLFKRSGLIPKSVIPFIVPYYTGEANNISAYAAVPDYHFIVGEMISRITDELKKEYPAYSFIGFTDHSPIDERAAALKAGLGVKGKNGLIINEKYGSYICIAAIFTDMPMPETVYRTVADTKYGCIGCDRCIAACPTGTLAFVHSGESDFSLCPECLSSITQKKGAHSEEEIALMKKHNTVWGCDICQKVCPHNKNIPKTPIEGFLNDRIPTLTEDIINGMSDEEFQRRAFSFRGRAVPLRNLKEVNN